MIDSIQSELAGGNYAAAIQDALGNTGASATMRLSGSQRSVSVAGAPTGIPLSYASEPATIISFSPAAQNILSDAQIALTVMAAARPGNGVKSTVAASGAVSEEAIQSPAQEPANQTISSASELSISGIANAAQNALSDPTATFHDIVNQQGGPASFASFISDPKERQSFINAFNNQTLIIQNAADVPGLNYQDHTVLTGSTEAVHTSYNEGFISNQMAAGTASGVMTLPVIGGIYLAWPNSSASSSPATSATPTGNS